MEVPDKIKETACTIVVLVLGDDDFSCLKQGVVVKSVEYDDMFEDPRAVVREWKRKAHAFACRVGATHLVMTPVFPIYFLSSDDETPKQLSRRKKQKKHLLEDT